MARWRERPEDSLRDRAVAVLGWDPGTDLELLALAAALLSGEPLAAASGT